jgi:LmbE family N-acetylglucosaminyl deacetylase
MSRILVIAPHCDDETYGMGGTIIKRMKQGDEVHIVAVCAGKMQFEHSGEVDVEREIRENEFMAVVNAYGCTGEILPFTQDSYLDMVPTRDIVNGIEKIQDKFRADIWYVAGSSYHQDHRKVFEACSAAARPTRKNVAKEIYTYEHPLYSWNPPVWKFTPQVYEIISEELNKKIEVCELYKSQLRPGMLGMKHIREFSIACGTEIGQNAAERFEVVRLNR